MKGKRDYPETTNNSKPIPREKWKEIDKLNGNPNSGAQKLHY